MNTEKREREASETREIERRKTERRGKREQKLRAETGGKRMDSIRERFSIFSKDRERIQTEEGKRQWGAGGKIPGKTEPEIKHIKRKREKEDDEKERSDKSVRKKKWGGGEKSIVRGKIRNS